MFYSNERREERFGKKKVETPLVKFHRHYNISLIAYKQEEKKIINLRSK